MDVDEWRTLLADATYNASHGNQAVGYALLAQAEAIYDGEPGPYEAWRDELLNARLYVTGTVDRLAVARANATPEDLGIVGEVLTSDAVGDGISLVAGTMVNAGVLEEDELLSGQDVDGKNRAPKVPSIKLVGGIAVAVLVLVVVVKVVL